VVIQLSEAGRLSSDAQVSSLRPEAVAVFDVGKSNVRLSAVNDTGVTMATLGRQNSVDSSRRIRTSTSKRSMHG